MLSGAALLPQHNGTQAPSLSARFNLAVNGQNLRKPGKLIPAARPIAVICGGRRAPPWPRSPTRAAAIFQTPLLQRRPKRWHTLGAGDGNQSLCPIVVLVQVREAAVRSELIFALKQAARLRHLNLATSA